MATASTTVANEAMGNILMRVARELTEMSSLARTLQLTLSPLLVQAGEVAMVAQDLDQLTQQIEGLSSFVAALGERCPTAWQAAPAEAATELPLHSQKLRLGSPAIDECKRKVTGIVELF